MAEINPLSFIGKSNDPSLTQRTVDASEALSNLQRGQAGLLTQRGTAIDTQRLANEGRLSNTALTNFLPDPSSPGFEQARSKRADLENLIKTLDVASTGRRAGLTPTIPEGGIRIEDILGSKFNLTEFPGAAQALAAGRVNAELSRQNKIKRTVDPQGKQVGTLAVQETTEGSSVKGDVKSVSPEQAQTIINTVKERYGLRGEPTNIEDTGDAWEISFSGTTKKYRVKKPKTI